MIALQPVTFVAGLPYRPMQYYMFECPVWIPDDIGSPVRFFNEACRLHCERWTYPNAAADGEVKHE